MTAADPQDDAAARRRDRRAARLAQPTAVASAQPESHPAHQPAPDPSTPPPADAPGMVRVDAGEWDRLRTAAAAPERIAAERARRDRDALVLAAVKAGKVTPYQGRQWAALLEADPDAAADLAAIPDGASGMPIGEPIGHAGRGQDTDQRTGWF